MELRVEKEFQESDKRKKGTNDCKNYYQIMLIAGNKLKMPLAQRILCARVAHAGDI